MSALERWLFIAALLAFLGMVWASGYLYGAR